jgi:hypothetical protein
MSLISSAVLDEWSLPPIDLWAVFPTGRQASAKARCFASFIEQQILTIPVDESAARLHQRA